MFLLPIEQAKCTAIIHPSVRISESVVLAITLAVEERNYMSSVFYTILSLSTIVYHCLGIVYLKFYNHESLVLYAH